MSSTDNGDARRGLTRITLVGPQRRVDLALPSSEPIGLLLPEVVRLTGYEATGTPRGYQMSLTDGAVLDPASTLAAAGLPDGALVRVDPVVESPPAAIVHDVTDEVVDDLDHRHGRWGESARRATAIVICAAAAAWAALQLVAHLPAVAVLGIGLVVLVAGGLVTVTAYRVAGLAAALAGAACTAVAIAHIGVGAPVRSAWSTVLVAISIVAVGSAARWLRAAMIGAASVVLFVALWTVVTLTRLSATHAAILIVLISLLVLGLLPRIAAVAAGLTRLDDARSEDKPVQRVAVTAAIDTAHRSLAITVVAASVSSALAGWLLAQQPGGWSTALACLTVVILLLRTRACPLLVEILSLLAAAGAVLVNLVRLWARVSPPNWWGGVAIAGIIVAASLLVLSYRPPKHLQARARQIADRVEGVAVVALIPVAVGGFGVYARLLDVF